MNPWQDHWHYCLRCLKILIIHLMRLLMVMNKVEEINSKTEGIIKDVLKHDNFDFSPSKNRKPDFKIFSEQFM